MSLSPAVQAKIEETIGSDKIVLFMKGDKYAPQCGFSATVVGILGDLEVDFTTFDILSDAEVREGIKEFSDWPTLPQLYINKEFQGGCDVVKEIYRNGELHKLLGITRQEPIQPTITITEPAAAALKEAHSEIPDGEGKFLKLSVDLQFQHGLQFGNQEDGDIIVETKHFKIAVEPMSTHRANNMVIDFVSNDKGTGFKIDNPNKPTE